MGRVTVNTRPHFADATGAKYPPTQSYARVKVLYLEALTRSPLCYAGRKTVRELLTHHDSDPLQQTSLCGAVASLLGMRCGVHGPTPRAPGDFVPSHPCTHKM